MARVITQETYDEVVRENIEEFAMTAEEAIEDAVKQFEAQDVDLTNIIKDLAMTSGADSHAISTAIKKLENYSKSKTTDVAGVVNELNVVRAECQKGVAHKVLAGKEGAYDVLCGVLQEYEAHTEVMVKCLEALVALMTGQPDLLQPAGVQLMIKYFDQQTDAEVQRLLLKWIRECCIKHEHNRQLIFDAAILEHLRPLLAEANAQVLRDICAVLRALVLDDDVRVEFGRAHEHARAIASDMLCPITDLLRKHKQHEAVVSELLLTLSALIVRSEFCTQVEAAGGLDFVLEALRDFCGTEKIARQAFKLLKVLAGNDECKVHAIQRGGAGPVAAALSAHQDAVATAAAGLNCVAALTLRCPDNSRALFDAGLPDTIVACMRRHPDSVQVQRAASWAIRNMVSRSRYQSDKFLALGVEPLLQDGLARFRAECEYDLKAALRDLGCKVDLKEEWTGKGGKLTTGGKLVMRRTQLEEEEEEEAAPDT